MKLSVFGFAVAVFAFAPSVFAQQSEPKSKAVLASDIDWEQLNPARGDASPQAATLWGDRKGTVATGFLVKFVDGFSSPPHIHNVSYRGVVIAGGIHNDDPDAKPMWMPTGSFWTQPAGEAHITSSRGAGIAYIEIENGPYLVKPTEEAFDNGERPINITPSNFVWLDASSTSRIERPAAGVRVRKGAEITFLWGKPEKDQLNGTLLKLPADYAGKLHGHCAKLQAVVIAGHSKLKLPNESDFKSLTPGSYVSSKGEITYEVLCEEDEGCLVYIRSTGNFKIRSD